MKTTWQKTWAGNRKTLPPGSERAHCARALSHAWTVPSAVAEGCRCGRAQQSDRIHCQLLWIRQPTTDSKLTDVRKGQFGFNISIPNDNIG